MIIRLSKILENSTEDWILSNFWKPLYPKIISLNREWVTGLMKHAGAVNWVGLASGDLWPAQSGSLLSLVRALINANPLLCSIIIERNYPERNQPVFFPKSNYSLDSWMDHLDSYPNSHMLCQINGSNSLQCLINWISLNWSSSAFLTLDRPEFHHTWNLWTG